MANLHIVPRKGRNLSTDEQQELYFPAVQYAGTIDTKEMARAISQRTSLSTGDVKNVLDALSVELQRDLALSYKVQLDGVGTFRATVKGSSKPTEEELSASDVEKVGVHYTPDKEIMQSLRDTPRKLVGKPAKKQAEAVEEAQTI